MKHLKKLLAVPALLLCIFCSAQEQEPVDEATRERQFREAIDKQITRMEDILKLEDWQVFYLDSIYTHDYTCLKDELDALQKKGMRNNSAYERARDKWMEQIYQAMHGVLDENQWNKYLKMGEAKNKKDRDKRAAKWTE
ncbi:MAG: hypothetical protein MJY42_02820 [Bacteroidales bacterium]|nr:hypothetical protein [Bacteroidales bacterium]